MRRSVAATRMDGQDSKAVWKPGLIRFVSRPSAYLAATAVVLFMVLVSFWLHRLLPHANLSLLFLTGVLIVAARLGIGPSLFSSLLCFLAYNFFFTTPYYTLAVANQGDVATLAFFLLIAAITGNLAARMRRESSSRVESLQRLSKLYEFSNRIAAAVRREDVLVSVAEQLGRFLDRPVVVAQSQADGAVDVAFESMAGIRPAPEVLARAWLHTGSAEFRDNGWVFLGLHADRQPIALVAIHGDPPQEQFELARSLCEQAAVALDRTRLAAELENARLAAETERLRSALLSSVSHDLRTPLASIIGSSSSLLEYGPAFSDADQRELLSTIGAEAQRLDRYIQNLLDMTRLGQGSLVLRRDWVDLHDLVAGAVGRLRDEAAELTVDVQIDEETPLVWIHGMLIEQALVNVLDNAIRFSPRGGRIEVRVQPVKNAVEFQVNDEGAGIPEAEREKIFDMFYTVRQGDRGQRQGTGLGLAICRGLVGAHGGSVTAHAGPGGFGTTIRIVLPLITPTAPDHHE